MVIKTFQFDYKKYETKGVSVAELDDAWAIIKSPATSNFQYIAKGIFLFFGCLYLYVRSKKIEEQMLIEKQDYEAKRTNSNTGQIGNDDLD